MSNGLLSKARAKRMLGVGEVGLAKLGESGDITFVGGKVAMAGVERILGCTIEAYEARQSAETPIATAPAEKSEKDKYKDERETLEEKNKLAAYKAGMVDVEQVKELAGKLATKEQELENRETLLKDRAIKVGGRELHCNETERALKGKVAKLHDNEDKLQQSIKGILEIASVEDTRPIRLKMIVDICNEYLVEIVPNDKKKPTCPQCKKDSLRLGRDGWWFCNDCHYSWQIKESEVVL